MSRVLVAGALAALLLTACNPQPGAAAGSDKVFGEKVRAYLLAHPEVIREAIKALQDKEDNDHAAVQEKARALIPALRAKIERDPRDYVANPNGRVTVTEFYDYRCPHCINAAPKVIALIKSNPDVRFVFKEMPIFGPTSEHAARAAIAVKQDGGDYLGLYSAMMAAHPLDDNAIDRIAQAHGAKPQTLLSPQVRAAADAQIADVTDLFTRLVLDGTPGFVIGNEVVYGEEMDKVEAAVARASGKAAPAQTSASLAP
jgi:protein-disulfide isomerase